MRKQLIYHTIFLVAFAISIGVLLRDHTGLPVGKLHSRPLLGQQSGYEGVNHMVSGATPFLAAGAAHDIWWFGWQREAFAVARLLNRPILLYIGSAWSELAQHIDRTVFTNRELADFINERVIPIRVDQDDRPDIEARYRLAARAIGGGVHQVVMLFLTPSGEVFFAADALDNPQEMWKELPTIIDSVSTYYQQNVNVVESNAATLRSQLKAYFMADWADASPPNREVIEEYLKTSATRFDGVHGGFSDQIGKWPDVSTLRLYLRAATVWQNRTAFDRAILTLDQMAEGGFFDPVDGGFHQGAKDAAWRIPYFGKRLGANAKLLRLYTDAYSVTRSAAYRDVAEATIDFLLRRLRDPATGVFASAELSTPETATWTKADLTKMLPAAEEQVAMLAWGVEQEPQSLPDLPQRNILRRGHSLAVIAQRLGWSETKVERVYRHAVALLQAHLTTRRIPVDHSAYANDNGLAMAALFRAGIIFDRPDAVQAAEQALIYWMEHDVDSGRGFRHRLDGERIYLLADQAGMLDALLAAYQATHNLHWREQAEKVAGFVEARFGAPLLAGFYDQYPDDLADPSLGLLGDPMRPHFDLIGDPTNAQVARAFLQLYYLTGNDDWRITADGIFLSFAELLRQPMNRSIATLVEAFYYQLEPPTQVMVVAESPDEALTKQLMQAVYIGGSIETLWQLSETKPPMAAPLPKSVRAAVDASHAEPGPMAFVCRRNHCSDRVQSPDQLLTILQGAPTQ